MEKWLVFNKSFIVFGKYFTIPLLIYETWLSIIK